MKYLFGLLIISIKANNLGTYALVCDESSKFQKSIGLPCFLFFLIDFETVPSPALYEARASNQSSFINE